MKIRKSERYHGGERILTWTLTNLVYLDHMPIEGLRFIDSRCMTLSMKHGYGVFPKVPCIRYVLGMGILWIRMGMYQKNFFKKIEKWVQLGYGWVHDS